MPAVALPAPRPPCPCRRTAFVYDMEDPEAGDIPTTLRRSKEDCPKVSQVAGVSRNRAMWECVCERRQGMALLTLQFSACLRYKRCRWAGWMRRCLTRLRAS